MSNENKTDSQMTSDPAVASSDLSGREPCPRSVEIAQRIWKRRETSVKTIARLIDAEVTQECVTLHHEANELATALRSVARHRMPDGSPCWCNEHFHAQAFAGHDHSPPCALARRLLVVETQRPNERFWKKVNKNGPDGCQTEI